MAGFLMGDKVISYNSCVAQLYFFAVFLIVETFLLASMAYDRHAAVCKPLHYTNIMTPRMCAWMVVGCYVFGFLEASVHTWNAFSLPFCRSNVVDHFFVMLHLSWLSHAQTATEVRWCFYSGRLQYHLYYYGHPGLLPVYLCHHSEDALI